MKLVIMLFFVLATNVALGQTKPVPVCDTTENYLITNLASVTIRVEVVDSKYKLYIFLPTERPEVIIKDMTLFYMKMQDDSSVVYLTRGNSKAIYSTFNKQYEYLLMLEGDFKDSQWQWLTKKRVKSIVNYTGSDFLIKSEDAIRFLQEIKCYATKFK